MVGVETITMPRQEARSAFLAYRRAFRDAKDKEQAKQDGALMRGYRAIVNGQSVIDLHQAMRGAGVNAQGLPKLAICRADETHCTVIMTANGRAHFYRGEDRWSFRTTPVSVPVDTFPRNPNGTRGTAILPSIPPQFRPPAKLDGYYLLWEAEWRKVVPVDPMLLKHLGGSLYAVLAQWDLTPLERAVLAGRL